MEHEKNSTFLINDIYNKIDHILNNQNNSFDKNFELRTPSMIKNNGFSPKKSKFLNKPSIQKNRFSQLNLSDELNFPSERNEKSYDKLKIE